MGSEEGYEELTEALEGTVSVREILSYIDSDRYMTLEMVLEYVPLSERNIRDRLLEIPHYRVVLSIYPIRNSENSFDKGSSRTAFSSCLPENTPSAFELL